MRQQNIQPRHTVADIFHEFLGIVGVHCQSPQFPTFSRLYLQEDSDSCGIYVCVFARIIIEGGAYFGLTNTHIRAFRCHMRKELHQKHPDSYSFPQNGGKIFLSSGASAFKCTQCQCLVQSARGLKIC
jgi:hypothetical protein